MTDTPTPKRPRGRPAGNGKGASPIYRVVVPPDLFDRLTELGPKRVREILTKGAKR